MDTVELYRLGSKLAAFVADGRPLEVGRAGACDIVVHDEGVAERHCLLTHRRGVLVAYDLAGPRRVSQPLPLDQEVRLGREHALVRRKGPGPGLRAGGQVARGIGGVPPRRRALTLRVGPGRDARHVRCGEVPISVGSAPDNDVVLARPDVSPYHCRLELTASGLLVRDLESAFGTFIQGVRVERAIVSGGARLRVGGAELHLVDRVESHALRPSVVAGSEVMRELLVDVERIAPLDWPVLIHGETGSGKEAIAQSLHAKSGRRKGPLVVLNAGGISAELVESELFGHERGAFTGAHSSHRGVFEQARGGTLFLDEVGELPLSLQARLLRVLETGEVRRVGAETVIKTDARLVCATHRDLRAMVATGNFREDLYYRVARLTLAVPPLRDRHEDLLPIAEHFLAEMADELGPKELAADAVSPLFKHPFPGNVRELRNVLSAAALESGGRVISRQSVVRALCRVSTVAQRTLEPGTLAAMLDEYDGNVSALARALGVPRSTLRDRVHGGAGTRRPAPTARHGVERIRRGT